MGHYRTLLLPKSNASKTIVSPNLPLGNNTCKINKITGDVSQSSSPILPY